MRRSLIFACVGCVCTGIDGIISEKQYYRAPVTFGFLQVNISQPRVSLMLTLMQHHSYDNKLLCHVDHEFLTQRLEYVTIPSNVSTFGSARATDP
jgi:hypothetical protein